MSKLSIKQRKHARLIPRLVDKAYELGYELSHGDAYRDPRCPYGHKNSLHRKRLANDYNFFKDNVWLHRGEALKELGEYWESLDPDCYWGGRFGESSPGAGDGWDGGHFSTAYRGMT
jgi:hypothetical protein